MEERLTMSIVDLARLPISHSLAKTTRTALGAAVISLVAVLSACSGAAPSGGGCASDSDCKGSRICSQGSCVDPGGAGGGNGSTSSGDCSSKCLSKAESCGATSSQAQSTCAQLCSLNLSSSQIQCLEGASCADLQNGDPCSIASGGGGTGGGSGGGTTNTGGGSTGTGGGGTGGGGGGGSTCGGSPCAPITCDCVDGTVYGPISYCFNDVCQDTANGCPDLCSNDGGWR
jgi:hypothetical protein